MDADGPPALVIGDARELEQVFVNLLTNARDASPDGGTVVLPARDATARSVRVIVADRGTGMTPPRRADLPAVLHDQEVGRHGPRPRHLARHRPAPRRRDRPRAARRRRRRGPRRAAARPRGIARMRVLVVDDEEVIRDVLGTLLTRRGLRGRGRGDRRRGRRPSSRPSRTTSSCSTSCCRTGRASRFCGTPPARPRRGRRDRHRVLLDRGRHRGHARGRVPLHPQAVPERGSPPDPPQGRRAAPAHRGEPPAARGALAALRPRPHRRQVARPCRRSSSSSGWRRPRGPPS